MAAQPTTQLQYQTRCRFCGMTPPPQPPFVQVVGGGFDPKLIQYVQALQKHIEKKHPKEFEAMAMQVMRFTGFATVGAFDIQDPLLISMQEEVRALFHRLTRKTYIPNEVIEQKVQELIADGVKVEDANGIRLLLGDMRDLLCEEGSYAPNVTTRPALVTP